MTKVSLIWAQGHDLFGLKVLGNNTLPPGELPWGFLPEDMAHFRRKTNGFPIVVGRTTWEGTGNLKGRSTVVVSSTLQSGPDVIARELQEALDLSAGLPGGDKQIWVIGGRALLQEAALIADEAWVTDIHTRVSGDVYAPVLRDDWWEVGRSPLTTSTDGISFRILHMAR